MCVWICLTFFGLFLELLGICWEYLFLLTAFWICLRIAFWFFACCFNVCWRILWELFRKCSGNTALQCYRDRKYSFTVLQGRKHTGIFLWQQKNLTKKLGFSKVLEVSLEGFWEVLCDVFGRFWKVFWKVFGGIGGYFARFFGSFWKVFGGNKPIKHQYNKQLETYNNL